MATVTRSRSLGTEALDVRTTRDREMLRDFLEQDRLFAAYAICDLDEREFGRTRWGVAIRRGVPRAVVMEYAGLSPQPVFVMGEPEGITGVLERVIRPRIGYISTKPEWLPAVEQVYRVDPGPQMVRMVVDRSSFVAYSGPLERLYPADIGDLNRLYNLGFTSWLPSSAIANGVYFGVRLDGKLVAAAGTHVISREARMAIVGNVLTHRDYRGRGLAKLTTAAVTAELLRTSDQVCLNVRSDNPPALAAYRAIGYRDHALFEERLSHRRGTVWDRIATPFRQLFTARRNPQ